MKNLSHFLEMTLDSKLNWKEHIIGIKAKVKKALNTIKAVAERMER